MSARDAAGGGSDESDEPREGWQVDARSGQGQQVGEGNVQHNWYGPPGPPALTQAVEQLGSDKLAQRLVGLSALRRIAEESEDDRATVAKILTAYVRERAPWPPASPGWRWRPAKNPTLRDLPPLEARAADVQRAVTMLGEAQLWAAVEQRAVTIFAEAQLAAGVEPHFLASVDLRKADLRMADLRKADLRMTNLAGADLKKANLSGAWLGKANLTSAGLGEANLSGAFLIEADLSVARLRKANLLGAQLWKANLTMAYLEEANLTLALLNNTKLIYAHLEGANLSSAHLRGADLESAEGLTQAQLDAARGDRKTRLPDGMKRPTSWTTE
jgi:uncharacterized protein YjbI with pentapeptide repeats